MRTNLPASDLRRTARVPCEIPVAVVSPACWPQVRILDLSRTGIRLGIPLEQEADLTEFSLESLVEQLREQLAVKVVIDLHPQRLGSQVRRGLRIVRVGPVREEDGVLELGCEVVPPIDDAEADVLGLPLPREGEPPDIARRRLRDRMAAAKSEGTSKPLRRPDDESYQVAARVPRPGTGRRAASGLKAVVISRFRRVNSALVGSPLEFSHQGGFVCVDTDGARLFREEVSLADRVIAFGKAYGQVVDVRISDPEKDLWCGPVRVVSVGIIPEVPGRLIVGFTFRRPLDAWEEAALGLNETAVAAPSVEAEPPA